MENKYGIAVGIPLAIGSVLGSGILFLPSLTFQVAGDGTITAWGLSTLYCILLIMVFRDMVEAVPTNAGIRGFVQLGLGKNTSNGVPLLFLGTVVLGMPCSAVIVGTYVANVFPSFSAEMVAYAIVLSAVGGNLLGLSIASRIQVAAICLVVFVAVYLSLQSSPTFRNPFVFKPSFLISTPVLQGVVIAFWAYAGFENLSFTAGEFKNPKRDLLISMAVSLLVTGIIYIAVTARYMACVSSESIKETNRTPLLLIASHSGSPRATEISVAVLALAAILINFISWIRGMSNMIENAARDGLFPAFLVSRKVSMPRKGVLFLGTIFCVCIMMVSTNPAWLDHALVLVSTNFVSVYVLAVLSYAVWATAWKKRLLATVLLASLLPPLAAIGVSGLYPIGLLAMGVLMSRCFSGEGRIENAE